RQVMRSFQELLAEPVAQRKAFIARERAKCAFLRLVADLQVPFGSLRLEIGVAHRRLFCNGLPACSSWCSGMHHIEVIAARARELHFELDTFFAGHRLGFRHQPEVLSNDPRLVFVVLAIAVADTHFIAHYTGRSTILPAQGSDLVRDGHLQGQLEMPSLAQEEQLFQGAGTGGLEQAVQSITTKGGQQARYIKEGALARTVRSCHHVEVAQGLAYALQALEVDRFDLGDHGFFVSSSFTTNSSFPRGSITFTATCLCSPAGKGALSVPARWSHTVSAKSARRARFRFFQAPVLGKKACRTRNTSPL